MLISPRKKRYFALGGDSKTTVLTEIVRRHGDSPALVLLAKTNGAITDEVTSPRLLSEIGGSLKGEMSIALPLHCFEMVSVTMPAMPVEAIDRALPYHLAKTIDRPLSEFIYDWQITQRLKDRLQLTVYLLPLGVYAHLKKEFNRRQISITFIEADIFAAYAYLDQNKRLVEKEASLCVIIWPNNISMAVFENSTMVLARTVVARQPQTAFNGMAETNNMPETPSQSIELDPELIMQLNQGAENMPSGEDHAEDTSSILQEFSLLAKERPSAAEKPATEEKKPAPTSDTEKESWDEYMQQLNLEIMRTRDYHSSVLKGQAIKNVYVTGADIFWDDLRTMTRSALGVVIEPLIQSPLNNNLSPSLSAICLGTGIRW